MLYLVIWAVGVLLSALAFGRRLYVTKYKTGAYHRNYVLLTPAADFVSEVLNFAVIWPLLALLAVPMVPYGLYRRRKNTRILRQLEEMFQLSPGEDQTKQL